jgi:excisionase family DNA binding protein
MGSTTENKQRVYKGASTSAPKKPRAERNGQLLTKEEVGDELAITVRMVERLIATGELPHVKVGSLVRVHRDDLNAYVQRQRREGR